VESDWTLQSPKSFHMYLLFLDKALDLGDVVASSAADSGLGIGSLEGTSRAVLVRKGLREIGS